MKLTDKLDTLMQERGITRGGLARMTGIPYTTIVGFYEKGCENIKLSNLRRLADFFCVSIEYLTNEDDESDDFAPYRMAKKYAALSQPSRKIVDGVVDGLMELESDPEERIIEISYIREYLTPAAAGYASPALGEDYVLVPKNESVPKDADFAVRIAGDSMEPYIADGSSVYVRRTNDLEPGDVGIFFVDGDMKCKQYCEDSFGNVYLFSLNRERADADVFVSESSGIYVYCFGKVLLPKRPPLPKA